MSAEWLLKDALKERSWLGVDANLSPERVVEVVRSNAVYPESGGFDTAGIARLDDGSFIAFAGGASCDTGWTCQASIQITVHPTLEDAWLNGTTADERAFIERGER